MHWVEIALNLSRTQGNAIPTHKLYITGTRAHVCYPAKGARGRLHNHVAIVNLSIFVQYCATVSYRLCTYSIVKTW